MTPPPKKKIQPSPLAEDVFSPTITEACAALLCPDCSGVGRAMTGGVCMTCFGHRAVKVEIVKLKTLPSRANEAKPLEEKE